MCCAVLDDSREAGVFVHRLVGDIVTDAGLQVHAVNEGPLVQLVFPMIREVK